MPFWLDSGMHDVVHSGNARTKISTALPQFVLNERESQKKPQNVWLKPYLAQMLTCRISGEVKAVTLILFPFQMVLVVILKFNHLHASELSLCCISNTLHPLIFTLTRNSSIKTHFSKKLTENHREKSANKPLC